MRNPDNDVSGRGEATVSAGTELDVSFTLGTNGNERYIPVGSSFSYHWELEDTTGSVQSSPEKDFVFLDGRYQWQQRTEGSAPSVTVYWYGNNVSRANVAIESAKAGLDKAGKLLETQVPYPIKVVVYGSEAEGEMAQRSRGRAFDATVQTGGTRVAPDLVLVFEPQVDIITHEVGHIVTHVAGDRPPAALPAWIDEGTAVWTQSSPGGGYLGALALAIQANDTLNLRSLQAPTNRPEQVNLFYGQSFSVVDYLVKTYGQPKYAELYRFFRDNGSMDGALQQIYGVDQNGLYNEWRKSKGLAELTFATPVAAGQGPAAEATRPPLGFPTVSSGGSQQAPASQPSSPDGAPATEQPSAGGVPTMGLAVLGGTLLLAVLLGGTALALFRRRPTPDAEG